MALTPNISLVKPVYNSVGWHTAVNGNFAIIDAILSEFFVQANFRGLWTNATLYEVGDRLVDTSNSNIYTCLIEHTSAASPTTFSTDRTNNPTYWENTTVVAATGRGAWVTATDYVKGDFVVDGTVYAVCTTNHTSGATFAGDAAYWEELIDVSGASIPDGSIDGAKFADPLTIPGATTITTGGLTVTAGGLTITAGGLNVVANSTTLQGTTIASGGLNVTAGGITVAAGGIAITTDGLNIAAGGATIVGNSTITGTLTGLTGLTVASGGLTVTTGGLTIAANGATITGNSTITGTLSGLTGLTVASGGASITGATTFVSGGVTVTTGGLTVTAGGLTVTAGGITATGNSTVTGTLTSQSFIPSSATLPTNGMYLPDTNTVGIATNGADAFKINASKAVAFNNSYGTSGQRLTSAGNGGPPTWTDDSTGLVLISSGSVGSGTTFNITDIPETYAQVILQLTGVSCSANRSLRIHTSVDNGSTAGATNLIDGTTGFINGSGDTYDVTITLTAYNSEFKFGFFYSTIEEVGGNNNQSSGSVKHVGNIDAFMLTWSGAGNFDAGTYALYGAV